MKHILLPILLFLTLTQFAFAQQVARDFVLVELGTRFN